MKYQSLMCLNKYTVKSFNFVITKFRGLTTMDVLWTLNSWISNYTQNITKVSKYFVCILKLSIALPTKNSNLNVQGIKMISQCHATIIILPY